MAAKLPLLLFYLLLTLGFAPVCAQQNVMLSGKIRNAKAKTVYVLRYELGQFSIADSARLNSNGEFNMRFHWSSPRAAIFQHADERTSLFLAPGYTLSLTADGRSFHETLDFSGHGRAINLYFVRKALFEEQTRTARTQAVRLPEAEFIRFTDSTLTVDQALLQVHFAGQKLSRAEAGFVEGLKTEMRYRWAKARADYPALHTQYRQLPQPYQPTEEYYTYLKRVQLNNPAALASPMYLAFLQAFIQAEVSRKQAAGQPGAPAGNSALLFEVINQQFKPGRVKLALLKEVLTNQLHTPDDVAAAARHMPAWLNEAKPWPGPRAELEALFNSRNTPPAR